MENASELLYMSHLCDSYAYKALFRMYEPMISTVVNTFMKRYAGCTFSREDLLQEGRVALLYAIRTYRNDRDTKFGTYASLLVRRKIQRHVIQTLRDWGKMKTDSDNDMVNEIPAFYDALPAKRGFSSPDYYCAYKAGLQKLVKLVGELSDTDRKVLEQWICGYSNKEIADRLGVSLKSFDNRMYRLRRKFKKCLYEDVD